MPPSVLCLLTVHGIGFQQAPLADGTPGYADRLHEQLSAALPPGLLGDDPQRPRQRRGEAGPVYVQSHWPPESNNSEAGLARLGRWASRQAWQIDHAQAPLSGSDARIAHVALVYSHLEDQGPHVGAALQASTTTAFAFAHYTTVSGLVRMALSDVEALLESAPQPASPDVASLRVRRPASGAADAPSGLLATLRTLEADVAAYICRNDLRERVRSFVFEALLRLCCREDVGGVVLNTHSNGTVVAFDVLQRFPPFAARKVRWFVTAGSPLRKYADLMYWGNQVGCMDAMGPPKRWTNFWDARDPVADPLAPPAEWRRGTPLPARSDQLSLFQSVDADTGVISSVAIEDILVDNVQQSRGGGLQAHNYWDNEREVVGRLAGIVQQVLDHAGSGLDQAAPQTGAGAEQSVRET